MISIIITTKNEGEVIARLLKSIQTQSHSDWEIIVVDNNSTDKTVSIAKRYTKNVYTYGPERSAQRNYGVTKAKGRYVLILDADMQLSKEVLSECVSKIKKSKMAGLVIPEESVATNYWEKVKAYERSFYNEHGDEQTDAARFFKRSVFQEYNGYDESITGPEDWDLPERMKKDGYRIGRIRTQIKHFERIPSLWSLMRKKYYYALKSHRYLQKHDIPAASPKTLYFLRPVFYKKWRRHIVHPVMSLSMVFMLTAELVSGATGYVVGRMQNL